MSADTEAYAAAGEFRFRCFVCARPMPLEHLVGVMPDAPEPPKGATCVPVPVHEHCRESPLAGPLRSLIRERINDEMRTLRN